MRIPEEIRSVAVIGFSKNAGKTTVLNEVIRAYKKERRLGLLSVGVDGEEWDAWSYRPKPRILAPKGVVVASVKPFLPQEDWHIVDELDIETVLGKVYIAQALRDTVVKLAGVPSACHVRQVLDVFSQMGIQLSMVDGAYDRKFSANPEITDGTIAVVGASAGQTLKDVLYKTEEFVYRLTLPVCNTEDPFYEASRLAMEEKRIVVVCDGKIRGLTISSFFQFQEVLGSWENPKQIEALAIPGALLDRGMKQFIQKRCAPSLIIPSAVHLLASYPVLKQFNRLGGKIQVMEPIRLLLLAMNPTSPDGYSFCAKEMKEQLQKCCPGVPVMDVLQECLAERMTLKGG